MKPTKHLDLRAPILTPRWVLLGKYLFFALFGGVAAVNGAPSLDLTTPEGYRPIWAGAIVLASAVCLIALAHDAEVVEFFGLLVLIPFLFAYVYAIASLATLGAVDKRALAVIVFAVLFLPVGRWLTIIPPRVHFWQAGSK